MGAPAIHPFCPEDLPAALRLLTASGEHPSAYATLQPGVRYFLDPVGYLAYEAVRTRFHRVNCVFAAPIASPDAVAHLLDRYLEATDCPTLFANLDSATAGLLGRRGLKITQMGTDYHVPLTDHAPRGRQMRSLRRAANLGDSGVEVREMCWTETPDEAVRALSRSWRRTKARSRKELTLLTRPPRFENEWQVRKFYAFREDRLLAFAFFDPCFRDGRVVGYVANILRSWPGVRPSQVLDYIVLEAMRKFRSEGCEFVSLGLAPFHGLRPVAGQDRLLYHAMRFAYERLNGFYRFKALAFHKARYRGVARPVYAATQPLGFLHSVRAAWLAAKLTNFV